MSEPQAPLFSVVTVAFNAARTIRRTLESVRAQTFADYEHLIIDGRSRDDTLSVVRACPDARRVVYSERDRGIYDAMNKGLALARGRYTLFLNSDDCFSDPHALTALAEPLRDARVDVAYGDVRFVSAAGATSRLWRPGPYRRFAFSLGWVPPHPSFTVRTELLRALGGFQLAYPIAADFDLMLRVLRETQGERVVYLPRELVIMEHGGESTANVSQMWRGLTQCAHAMEENAVPLWPLAAVLKPMRAFTQLLAGARHARSARPR